MPSITILPATPEDRAAWLTMRCALWPAAPEEHAPELDILLAGRCPDTGAPSRCWIARVGDTIAGFVEVTLRGYVLNCTWPSAHIEGIYVAPEHRSRGVAEALFHEATRWAQASGCHAVTTDLDSENVASMRAHQRAGFEDVETSHVMQIALAQPRLEASGLALAPLNHTHTAALVAHWNEPAVRRGLWEDRWVSLERVEAALEADTACRARHGAGLFGLLEPARGALVGCAGLAGGEEPELVVSLASAWWGRGLAAAAAQAVVAHVWEATALTRLWGAADEGDTRAARLMDRLGFEPPARWEGARVQGAGAAQELEATQATRSGGCQSARGRSSC